MDFEQIHKEISSHIQADFAAIALLSTLLLEVLMSIHEEIAHRFPKEAVRIVLFYLRSITRHF